MGRIVISIDMLHPKVFDIYKVRLENVATYLKLGYIITNEGDELKYAYFTEGYLTAMCICLWDDIRRKRQHLMSPEYVDSQYDETSPMWNIYYECKELDLKLKKPQLW